MEPIVCPKCHSSRIDRGQNYLVSLAGLALIVISLFLIVRTVLAESAAIWAAPEPHEFQSPVEAIPLIIGFYLCFAGIYPTRRVRCLDCGEIWERSEGKEA